MLSLQALIEEAHIIVRARAAAISSTRSEVPAEPVVETTAVDTTEGGCIQVEDV